MIYAEYDPRVPRLSVTGHAGAAPRGEDLICAGVTTLVEGLALAVESIDGDATIVLGDGVADIRCERSATATGAFSTAVSGLRWLSAHYPEYVRVEFM